MVKTKRIMKKNVLMIVSVIVILVLIGAIAYILINNQGKAGNGNGKTYCTEASRSAEVCTEIYQPVCGFPAEKTYSNPCFACMNEAVDYYVSGECQSS